MTGKLLLSVIFADSVSITYPHAPDEAQLNMYQVLLLASIRLICLFPH